jgi:sirohydrochlorin cobaltochelatase
LSDVRCAYFLIAHGSRDVRSQQGLEACAALVNQHLENPPLPNQSIPMVGTGVLEFGDRLLGVQIADFAKAAATVGVGQVFLVPLFLAAGNHVLEDLPEAIALAQSHLDANVALTLCPVLGTHPHLSGLVQTRMGEVPSCDRWILLAHGTRRTDGNQPIEVLATELGIGIAPYFLFAGRITDAIESHVVELRSKFTALDLQLTQPLNPSPLLAKLLLDRCAAVSVVPQ